MPLVSPPFEPPPVVVPSAGAMIQGTFGDDTLNAGDGDDSIQAYDGNDLVNCGGGNDNVIGWAGNHTMFGGVGSDVLLSGLGDDLLDGGIGNDVLIGGMGSDVLTGGEGNDMLFAGDSYDPGFDSLDCGNGDDTALFSQLATGVAYGGEGSDWLVLNYEDTYGSAGPITVILTGPGATARQGSTSIAIDSFERLNVYGHYWSDFVDAGDLDDQILVSLGANTVNGHDGNDLIGYATGEINLLDGGEGTDRLQVEALYGDPLVFSATGGFVSDGFGSVLAGFETFAVLGGRGEDSADLGSGADLFQGGRGNDTGRGNDGDDILQGNQGADLLDGGNGVDRLQGGFDDDTLLGGSGSDILNGWTGTDVLTGGTGRDTFRFGPLGDTGDVVTDFRSGVDRVVVHLIVANDVLPAGALDPARFALGASSGPDGQFVYRDAQLFWDANGAAEGDGVLLATFLGDPALVAGDITLGLF